MTKLFMQDVADFLGLSLQTCKSAKLVMPAFASIFSEIKSGKHKFITDLKKYEQFVVQMGGEEIARTAIRSACSKYCAESIKKSGYQRKSRVKADVAPAVAFDILAETPAARLRRLNGEIARGNVSTLAGFDYA